MVAEARGGCATGSSGAEDPLSRRSVGGEDVDQSKGVAHHRGIESGWDVLTIHEYLTPEKLDKILDDLK